MRFIATLTAVVGLVAISALAFPGADADANANANANPAELADIGFVDSVDAMNGTSAKFPGIANSCNTPMKQQALCRIIKEGIGMLHKLGKKKCSAQPGELARVSCSYKSAIYLYNPGNAILDLPCDYVADIANTILDTCGGEPCCADDIPKPGPRIMGSTSHENGRFVVSVIGDDC